MMSSTALALVGFIIWFMLLLSGIILLRILHTARTGKPANSYLADGSDVSPFSQRLCAAHMNGIESVPFMVGLPLLAIATGSTAVTDPLAMVVLVARIGQTSTHLYSTSETAVKMRAGFFTIQVGVALYWAASLLAVLSRGG
jgi:uncharacterized MAPEG superfamily protein